MKNGGGPEGGDTSWERSRYQAEREREYYAALAGLKEKGGEFGGR